MAYGNGKKDRGMGYGGGQQMGYGGGQQMGYGNGGTSQPMQQRSGY